MSMFLEYARKASASSRVTGGQRIASRRSSSLVKPRGHFCIWKVCAPRMLISCSIVPCTTEIAVMTAMIDETPSTMPNSVSDERSLLARIACRDIRKLSTCRIVFPRLLVAQRFDRVEPRALQRRHEPGDDADQHRDND